MKIRISTKVWYLLACIALYLLTIWGFTFYYPTTEAILLGQSCFVALLVLILAVVTHFQIRKK